MRYALALAAAAYLLFVPHSAMAKDDSKVIGSWMVSHTVDNMDDSIKDIAITPDTDEKYILALRCFGGSPEAFVFVGKDGDKFEDKDGYKIMFRQDQHSPIDLTGEAQSNGSVSLSKPSDVIRGAMSGSKLAFRFAGLNESFSSDVVFQTLRSKDALSGVAKNCSIATQ